MKRNSFIRTLFITFSVFTIAIAAKTFSSTPLTLPFPKLTASESHNPFSFIVYGDIQNIHDNGHQKLVNQIEKQNVSLILNTGDISPDDGKNFDQFHSEIKGIATQIPFFPAVGNHDVEFYSPQSRNSFQNYFQNTYKYLSDQPLNAHLSSGNNNQRLWYAFRYATSHFLVLDSNLIIDSGEYRDTHSLPPYRGLVAEQFRFAREVLEQADQDPEIKSKFVLFHHSPFISNENSAFLGLFGGHEDDRGMMIQHGMPSAEGNGKEYLLDLFRRYDVKAVFSGHEHYYERWAETIIEGNGLTRDLTWIVTGTGGARPRKNKEYGDDDVAELFEEGELYDTYLDRIANINSNWSAKMDRAFPTKGDSSGKFQNYIIVHVDGTNVRFETIDTNGTIRDSGTL